MESHSGSETEEKRRFARRKLRTRAEELLKRYGQPSLGVGASLGVKDVGLRFADGSMGHLLSIGSEGTPVIKINVYKTDDPLGPLTQYTSWNWGEFTRSDVNPQDMGAISSQAAQELGPEAMAANMALGSLAAGLNIVRNAEEGIDGHPITAQEARDLLERLKEARIEQL